MLDRGRIKDVIKVGGHCLFYTLSIHFLGDLPTKCIDASIQFIGSIPIKCANAVHVFLYVPDYISRTWTVMECCLLRVAQQHSMPRPVNADCQLV